MATGSIVKGTTDSKEYARPVLPVDLRGQLVSVAPGKPFCLSFVLTAVDCKEAMDSM